MHLYFLTTSAATANVQFFIRPRTFKAGDTFVDASSMSGEPVKVSKSNEVGDQIIAIPASRLDGGALWVISIQRQGSEETYTNDVILTAVSLSYVAVR